LENRLKAVVLAAGRGTRMQTEGEDLPKVLREACARPLLYYVLDALSFLEKSDAVIVAGYQKEKLFARFPDRVFAVQAEQLGTGHALQSALPALGDFTGSVLVCYGDMPLLRRETYEALAARHAAQGNDCTLLSDVSAEPLPFGRVIRDGGGAFLRIVEDRDCTDAERAVTELNSGVYAFKMPALVPALQSLGRANAQGEYYLTDVPGILRAGGARVGVCCLELGDEIVGVNTPEQLRLVEDILRARGAAFA
jgi:UDP-N-acetylglucosamine diphosphorylase/glucosamine-1-phosphate N-acetyltransferase